jgi:hypothetical protein
MKQGSDQMGEHLQMPLACSNWLAARIWCMGRFGRDVAGRLRSAAKIFASNRKLAKTMHFRRCLLLSAFGKGPPFFFFFGPPSSAVTKTTCTHLTKYRDGESILL